MDECVINVEVFGGLNNENFSEVEFDWKGRLRRLWEEVEIELGFKGWVRV